MGFLVDTSRIAVRLDEQHIIWIKRRMSFGDEQDVQSAATRFVFDEKGKAAGSMDVGLYQKALLQINVVGWEGPEFAGTPCTPDNVLRLDRTAAERVLAAIEENNQPPASPDPKDHSTTGSSSTGAVVSTHSENGATPVAIPS